MNGMHFIGRVTAFQPATWFTHLVVAEAIWLAVDLTPRWATAVLLVLAVGVFAWREYRNYHQHKAEGGPMRRWVADGVGDMIGPLVVFAAAVSDPWVAHTIGLFIMGIGTIAWVGLGWGGQDAA